MSGSICLESKFFLELVQEEARLFVDTDLAISYKLSRDHVDEMFFEKELAKLSTDDVVMPIMRCSDLVDCSCDDPCDWETAFSTAHDFSDTEMLENLSKHPVFLKVVDTKHSLTDFVHEAEFLSFSTETSERPHEGEDAVRDHSCSVIGCDQSFPDSQPNGWSLDVPNAGPVCSKHDLRVRRWKKLWSKKTSNLRTGPVYEAALLENLWTPDELKADDACRCEIQPLAVSMTTQNLWLMYKGVKLHFQRENDSHLCIHPTVRDLCRWRTLFCDHGEASWTIPGRCATGYA